MVAWLREVGGGSGGRREDGGGLNDNLREEWTNYMYSMASIQPLLLKQHHAWTETERGRFARSRCNCLYQCNLSIVKLKLDYVFLITKIAIHLELATI